MSEPVSPNITGSVDGQDCRFLIFTLAQEQFALPLLSVKEVIAVPAITPIPATPAHVLGLMNLRGQVIPIIDLATKLKIKDSARGQETAVIILDLNGASLGVVVSSVNNVLALSPDQISAKSDGEGMREIDYFSGVAKQEEKLILMLDLAKLLCNEDIQNFTKQSKAA